MSADNWPDGFAEEAPPDTLQIRREAERSKYERIYHGGAGPRQYGQSNHWRGAWPLLKDAGSLLDVGTGHGHLIRELYRVGCRRAVGLDFVDPGWARDVSADGRSMGFVRGWAHDLPFGACEFDYVTAFDTLEHLLPEDVPKAITEMARVAYRAVVASICYHPSKIKVNGRGLHPSVYPKDWWKATLCQCTGGTFPEEYGHYLICRFGNKAAQKP
jgi:ubiquinone/menaquinone biosynthesis C-methylase UbiE